MLRHPFLFELVTESTYSDIIIPYYYNVYIKYILNMVK